MASKELLEAAILQLRAKALESYAIIKDTLHSTAGEGDLATISQQALLLAQYEGGMVSLQQYADSLLQPAPTPVEVEEENEEEPEPTPASTSHEELISRSPTYRKSIEEPSWTDKNAPRNEEE